MLHENQLNQEEKSNSEDDFLTEKASENKTRKSFLKCVAKLSLVSIPHLVIVALCVVYLLIGSAILNEIEASEQVELNLTNFTQENTKPNSENLYKYEAYIMFNKYKLKLNDIYMDVLINLKKHQTDITTNYKKFLTKLDKLLINEIYNKTENNSDIDIEIANSMRPHFFYDPNDSDTQKEEKYLNSKQFISEVFRIQNENSIYLLQTIANHLIETKNDMRLNISKNIKSLISGYKRKHSDSEKKLFEFIQNHLNVFSENNNKISELDNKYRNDKDEKKKEIESNRPENVKHVQIANSTNFFKSLKFMITLISSIGHNKESPQSWLSRVFLIVYLLIGLPLALLLLSVLRSIVTLHLKFIYEFISLAFNEYNDRLAKFFKFNIPFANLWLKLFYLLRSKKSTKLAKKSISEYKKSADFTQKNNSDMLKQETFFQFLLDLIIESIERTNNSFEFSMLASLSFLFIYILIGSFFFTNSNQDYESLINSFYFIFIFLTRIDIDLIETNSSLVSFISILYLAFGVALTSLCIQNLTYQLKFILDENVKRVLLRLILFLNQFGCEFKLDEVNIEFDAFIRTNSRLNKYASKSTLSLFDDDEDLDLSTSRKMSLSGRIYSRRSSNSKKSDISKSDKQTQITTLLCSKLIKVKELSASYASFVETSRSVSSATSESIDSKASSFTFEPKRRMWSDENLNRRYSSLDPITDTLTDNSNETEEQQTPLNELHLNDEIKSILNDIETLRSNEDDKELESDTNNQERSSPIKVNRFVTKRPLSSD